jgi:hypothetical protein
MSNVQSPVRGACLCGAIQFEITPPYLGFWYCHCERCQRSSGSAHASNIFMKPEQFKWLKGENNITLFIHKEAEDYPRAFCKTCGSPVPRFFARWCSVGRSGGSSGIRSRDPADR